MDDKFLRGLPFDLQAKFKEYRLERFKKECPMCSDLQHGYVEGCNVGYNKIKEERDQYKELFIEVCNLLDDGCDFLNKPEIKSIMESE